MVWVLFIVILYSPQITMQGNKVGDFKSAEACEQEAERMRKTLKPELFKYQCQIKSKDE